MKKQKQNYCKINQLLYGLIIFLLSMASSEYVNAQVRVGMNLGGPVDGRVFVDVVRVSDPFGSLGATELALDANGWPATDFKFVMNMRLFGNWTPETGTTPDDPEGYLAHLEGVYKVSFNGKVDHIFGCCGAKEIGTITYNAAQNLSTFDYTVLPGGIQNIFILDFYGTQRTATSALNTGITNLKFIRPGYDANTTQVFTNEWLNFITPFKAHRYMDWSNTNSNAKFVDGLSPADGVPLNSMMPLEVDWNDRLVAKPSDAKTDRQYSKGLGKKGLPWETILEHANVTNSDPWICVPVHASDDYITKLAQLFKNNLNSNLKIYVQYTNEVWNYGFTQFNWNYRKASLEVDAGDSFNYKAGGAEVNDNLWAVRRNAKRTVDISNIFKAEFGSNARILLPNMASQMANLAAGGSFNCAVDMLEYINTNYGPPKDYIYGYAEAGYAGSIKDLPEGASVAEIMAEMNATSPDLSDVKELTLQYGIKLTAYEGAPGHQVGNMANLSNRILAARTPEMGTFVEKILVDIFEPNNGDLFMYYTSHNMYTRFGMWGATDDSFLPHRNHKYQALLNVISGNVNRIPVITQEKTLKSGVFDTDYSYQLKSSGGDAPVVWNITSGSLPPGLLLNASGLITGLPSQEGNYTFTVNVTDNTADTDQKELQLQILTPVGVPFTTNGPIIDGTVEAFWSGITSHTIQNTIGGPSAAASDISGNYKIAWDANNLYFLLTVTDDVIMNDSENPWEDDSAEILIDVNADRLTSYGPDDFQIFFPMGEPVFVANGTFNGTIESSQIATSTGYVLEVAIPWGVIGSGTPSNGDFIGFEVGLNDDDDGGVKDTKLYWNGLENEAWHDPSTFGLGVFEGIDPNKRTLTVNAQNGTVAKSPNKEIYDINEAVTLTATADAGYIFTGWSGDASGAVNPMSVTMDDHKNITANFALTIPLKTSSPTIDGTADTFWDDVASVAVQKTIQGSAVSASDLSASFKAAWTNSNLYFFVTVIDDNFQNDSPDNWNDDAVEIYIDINNDKFTSYGSDDFQMIFPQGGDIQVLGNSIDVSGFQRSQIATSTGYVLELAIPWSAFGSAVFADGTEIGVDVHVNDDDDGGNRDTKLAWHTTLDDSWKNPSLFGTGVLSDGNSTPGGIAYRYLRITFDDYANLTMRELEWITNVGAVPASAMTSNNSVGVVASNSTNWGIAYRLYDDNYDSNNGIWVGNTGSAQNGVTLDLIDNPVIPTAIKIHKASWSHINEFTVEGSNNGNSWDLLLNKTSANGEFEPSGFTNVTMATFEFSTPSPITKTLNITAVNGTVSKSPDKSSYTLNESVTLTATAASGYEFSGWSGDASGTANPLTIAMNSDKNITANFTEIPIGTSYRYLKVTFTDYNNFKVLDVDWLTSGGSVPAAALTSNNSAGVIVSGFGNHSYYSYDDSYMNITGNWVGTGTTPKSVTIDLGSNTATPNAIKLYQHTWGAVNAFRAEGSNDNVNWDLLLNKTNANGEFVLSSVASNVREAIFSFSGATAANAKMGGGIGVAPLPELDKSVFEDIRIFPNPVMGSLNISVPNTIEGNLTMSLMSITGELIWKRDWKSTDNNVGHVDISRLEAGLYILEFRNDLTLRQYKIIKQ